MNEKPNIIIHYADYTAVDKVEDEKELCSSVNAEGTKSVAEAAMHIKAKVVYINTDCVCDGLGQETHSEDKETNHVIIMDLLRNKERRF